MEFFVRPSMGDMLQAPPLLPAVVLLQDDWDDFHYRTTFDVCYFDAGGNMAAVGRTKILQNEPTIQGKSKITSLPERFQELSIEHCSLGQSLLFYQSLLELVGEQTAREILHALRDVIINPAYATSVEDQEAFTKSLLRFSEARKAYSEAGALFGHEVLMSEGFHFKFTCQLSGFSRPHVIPLDFRSNADLPHRIICFVGKNGTGKSGVLARLATTLSGWAEEIPEGTFEPEPPRFSRVVSLSYSVFQPFEPPTANTTSYRYCGLRDEKNLVDVGALHERTLTSIKEVQRLGRAGDWLELMRKKDLFGAHLPDLSSPDGLSTLFPLIKTLSSGQRIIVSIFSDLLQHISQESLILFDEPEIYLHPTLLSTLLRMLHELLRKYDSYAIIATHSPIVIQEIPARSVRVFERGGSVPSQAPLPIESFGENLTELVDHVFRVNEDDKNYKTQLRALLEKHSYEEILALFGGRLSLNARMYLLSLQGKE